MPAVIRSKSKPKQPVITPNPPGSPLVVVKKDERELLEFVSTEFGFLTTFGRWESRPLKFEPYQVAFLTCRSRYRCVEKGRQTGYSFVWACEALARSHLRPAHTTVFISYNQEDSKEKIVYVKQLHEALPLQFQKKIGKDKATEVSFKSNTRSREESRIFSWPSRAPRGKHGSIYLDEFAHYQNDREVFTGSTALVLRGKDQLSICSTPLGQRGMFYEIARGNVEKYANYWRQTVPWYRCSFFLDEAWRTTEKHAEVIRNSVLMTTEERVERYGSQDIKDQLEMLGLEDFQQEFECAFIDERGSFFPYDLVLPCMFDAVNVVDDFNLIRRPKGRLVAGMDIGRHRDLSEVAIFDEVVTSKGRELTLLCVKSYDHVPFASQEQDVRRLLSETPIARFSIDKTAIGEMIAENLKRSFPCVELCHFTQPLKETLAYDFKRLLQDQAVRLPADRIYGKKILSQLHAIKKKVTEHGNVTFFAERTRQNKGHADLAWAIMLACQKERREPLERVPEVTIRFFE